MKSLRHSKVTNVITRVLLASTATGIVGLAAFSTSSALSGGGGSISNTGYKSHNSITNKSSTKTTVNKTNDVEVVNSSEQSSVTGDANVKQNTTGGDATSGDSSNSNSTTLTLTLSN